MSDGLSPAPSATADWTQCLNGVRVVDFSWVVAGPMATKRLGAMGAEIIKIESATRPEFSLRHAWFSVVNNNKRSCTLNIASAEGQALIHALVAESDIVVENFSSRVLTKNNLSYDDLRKVKPDIIYVSASGLGRTGPENEMLAYGSLLQGYSGRVAMIGAMNAGLEGMGIAPGWTDPVTSLWEGFLILAALRHHRATGEGCYIDLSMLEASVTLLPDALLHAALGQATAEQGSESEIGASPSGCFRCKGEDAWVAVSVRDDGEWRGLRAALDVPDDPAFSGREARIARRTGLNAIVAAWCAGRTAVEAEATLQSHGVPSAISQGIREVLDDPHLKERDLFRQVGDGSWSIALPWMEAGGWRGGLSAPPKLGADNDYVFGELLGVSPEEQARLKAAGVIA